MTDELSTVLAGFNEGILHAHRDDLLNGLDSLDLVNLAAYLRANLGIKINLEDINRQNFATLDTLVRLIESKHWEARGQK